MYLTKESIFHVSVLRFQPMNTSVHMLKTQCCSLKWLQFNVSNTLLSVKILGNLGGALSFFDFQYLLYTHRYLFKISLWRQN